MSAAAFSPTQPVCSSCWLEENPGRRPHREMGAPWERCCVCGTETSEGIYAQVDLARIPYPTTRVA